MLLRCIVELWEAEEGSDTERESARENHKEAGNEYLSLISTEVFCLLLWCGCGILLA